MKVVNFTSYLFIYLPLSEMVLVVFTSVKNESHVGFAAREALTHDRLLALAIKGCALSDISGTDAMPLNRYKIIHLPDNLISLKPISNINFTLF